MSSSNSTVSNRLAGRSALITGATRGIGLATAKRFIEDGCEVMIWDVDEKMGLEASKELKCQFLKVLILCK